MGVIRKKRSRSDVVSDALHTAGAAVADRVSALTGDPKPRRRRPARRLFGLAILAGLGYAVARRVRGSSADQPVHVTSAPQTWAPRPVPAATASPEQPAQEPPDEPPSDGDIAPADTHTDTHTDSDATIAAADEPSDETPSDETPSDEPPSDEPPAPEAPDEPPAPEPSPPSKRPAKKAAPRPRSSTATSRPPHKAPAKKAAPKSPPGSEQS